MAESAVNYRTRIIQWVTFLGGLYWFVEFILPTPAIEKIGLDKAHEKISNGFVLVGAMAFGLGLVSLVRFHGARIVFRRKDYPSSVVLICGLIAAIAITTASWFQSLGISGEIQSTTRLADFGERLAKGTTIGTPNVTSLRDRFTLFHHASSSRVEDVARAISTRESSSADMESVVLAQKVAAVKETLAGFASQLQQNAPEDQLKVEVGASVVALREVASAHGKLLRKASEQTLIKRLYTLVMDGLVVSLGSAMFSLLGFYIASAAYRAFRVHSVEAGLMMISAVLVMLGQISFGEQLWSELPHIRQWLLEVPNSAAFRAIRIGAALAGLLLAVRMWLSIESSSVSPGEER
jgi:hypothetical protein